MSDLTRAAVWIDSALTDAGLYSEQRSFCKMHGGPASEIYLVEEINNYPNGLVIKKSELGELRATHVVEVYQELIDGNSHSAPLYANLAGNDSVVTIDEWRPGHAGSHTDFDRIFHLLLGIHCHRSSRTAPSSYSNVDKEVSWGKAQSDVVCRDSARAVEAGLTSGLDSLLRYQGVWTHGDAKPTNCLVNNDQIILIDWDKACSISPLLDLAFAYYCFVPEFTSAQLIPPAHYLDYVPSDPTGPALGDVLDFSASMHFLHDAIRSFESTDRMTYFNDEAAPRYRAWLDVKGCL